MVLLLTGFVNMNVSITILDLSDMHKTGDYRNIFDCALKSVVSCFTVTGGERWSLRYVFMEFEDISTV